MQTRRYGDYQADIYLDGLQDIADLRVASAQRISLRCAS